MTEPLWQHQKDALTFAEDKPAVMFAHDMATGKTRTTLQLVHDRQCQFIVLFCPEKTKDVFKDNLAEYFPQSEIQVHILEGIAIEKSDQFTEIKLKRNSPILIITNYESIIARSKKISRKTKIDIPNPLAETIRDAVRDYSIDCCILDESHRIRGYESKTSVFFKDIGRFVKNKIALTGTPFHHSPLNIYGQFRFLNRDIFPESYRQFKYQYAHCTEGKHEEIYGYKNLDKLHQQFYKIAHRVESDDVLDLPEAQHKIVRFDLEPTTRQVYEMVENKFTVELKSGNVNISNALVWFLRLQQLTSGYLKPDRDEDGKPIGEEEAIGNEKELALSDLFEDFRKDEPIIVFCKFRYDLDAVHRVAAKHELQSCELSGRKNDLKLFQNKDGPTIFAVQIQSGKEGIDLTRARYNVYYSHQLSYGDYQQSLKRSRRPGQTRTVFYIHLVAKNSIDGRIMSGLKSRGKLIDRILNGYEKECE